MKGTVLYGPRDIRFEHRDDPKIIAPTDAIIRMMQAVCAAPTCGPIAAIMRLASRHRWAMNTAASSRKSGVRSKTSSPANS